MATYGELITRVMTRLSAMGGLDVQTYMQPKIAEMIRYRYDQIFIKRFWRSTTIVDSFLIDPLTGMSIGLPAPPLVRFIDIQYIFPEGSSRPLPERHRNRNPLMQRRLCYEPNYEGGHVFRILPVDSSTPIEYGIIYRSLQTSWLETDEINLDDQLMILGVCADYSIGEGANMEMAQMFGNMYAERMAELVQAEIQHEKSLDSGEDSSIYQWH